MRSHRVHGWKGVQQDGLYIRRRRATVDRSIVTPYVTPYYDKQAVYLLRGKKKDVGKGRDWALTEAGRRRPIE